MLARCFALLFLLFGACSSDSNVHSFQKIGVDPTWSPLRLGELQPFVNGYTEDFLIQMTKDHQVELLKMTASWDNLILGLQEKKYDAIISSLPPYSFNQVKFEFSNIFLELGPVLVSRLGNQFTSLDELKQKLLGVLQGGEANLLVSEHPQIILRAYSTVPDLLQDLRDGKIDSALLSNLFAQSYVQHLFYKDLHITSKPLTDHGLRLITRKGESRQLMDEFNQQLAKKQTTSLKQKWNLY